MRDTVAHKIGGHSHLRTSIVPSVGLAAGAISRSSDRFHVSVSVTRHGSTL